MAVIDQYLQQILDATYGEEVRHSIHDAILQNYIDVTETVAQTNAAASNANTAAQNADTKATLAETAATNADTKATLAETAATNADTKAALANTAAQNADTARDAANTAATNANEKANLADTSAARANQAAASAENIVSDLTNNFVKVSETQPTTTTNKLWLKPSDEDVVLAEMSDVQPIADDVDDLKSTIDNNIINLKFGKLISLTTATDYNDLPVGDYVVTSNAYAALMTNCPTTFGHRVICFNSAAANRYRQIVIASDKIYTRALTASGWNAWEHYINTMGLFAPEFSETSSYSVGDIVTHNEALYVFISAHTSGAWNTNEVRITTLGAEIEKTNIKTNNLESALPKVLHLNTSALIRLTTATDYNNLRSPADYFIPNNASAGLMTNCPVTTAHRLIVGETTLEDRVFQLVISAVNSSIYIRFFTSAGWSTWESVAYNSYINALLSNIILPTQSIAIPANFFNPNNVLPGYYDPLNSGEYVSDNLYICSDYYIPCYGKKKVVCSHKFKGNTYKHLAKSYIYFDKDKQFLTVSNQNIPQDAWFVKISDGKQYNTLLTGYDLMWEIKDEDVVGEYSEYFEPYEITSVLKKQVANVEHTLNHEIKSNEINEWLNDASGMFIHWGIYAATEGIFNGTDTTGQYVEYNNADDNSVGSEWIMYAAKIPKATYKGYSSGFTSTYFDADSIAKLAYEAGMKYIVITVKHHEGFVLYPSQYAEWTIADTPARVTVLDELKSACEKYGLKFCLYFSQFYDWTTDGGFGQQFINGSDPYTAEEHEEYVNYTINILSEMMEKYRPYVLWWDSPLQAERYSQQIFEWLKKYPNVITNDRLGTGIYEGDYATGEGRYYQGNRKAAENCFTLNGTWGYCLGKDNASHMISAELLFKRYILESVARGQNVLLNIGPKKDGSIPQLQIDSFNAIADFCQKYGLFEGKKRVNTECQPVWGRMFAIGNKLKCFAYEGSTIRVDGINTKYIKSVRVYGAQDEYASSNYNVLSDTSIAITNLVEDPTYGISVAEIEFNNTIISDDINYLSDNEKILAPAYNFNGKLSLDVSANGRTYIRWSNNDYYLNTRIKFTGESGAYHLNNDYIALDPGASYSLSVSIKNGETTQTASMTGDAVSSGTVNLVNGTIYEITVHKTGSGFVAWRSMWFET